MVHSEVMTAKLAEILERLDPKEWPRLEALLVKGETGTMYGFLNMTPMTEGEARELIDAASDEMHHHQNITNHRKKLHEFIDGAQVHIQRAVREIGILDELGDVEYEGGSPDLDAFLNDAARLLRAGQKVKPTDKDGNV